MTMAQSVPQTPSQPQLTPEQQRFAEVLQRMILDAQECAFKFAIVEEMDNLPNEVKEALKAGRRLLKDIHDLIQIIREQSRA